MSIYYYNYGIMYAYFIVCLTWAIVATRGRRWRGWSMERMGWTYYHSFWTCISFTLHCRKQHCSVVTGLDIGSYHIARRNFANFTNFVTCSRWWSFLFTNFLSCVNDQHRRYGDLYRISKNLFHRIFLQYKSSWAWGTFILMHIKSSSDNLIPFKEAWDTIAQRAADRVLSIDPLHESWVDKHSEYTRRAPIWACAVIYQDGILRWTRLLSALKILVRVTSSNN